MPKIEQIYQNRLLQHGHIPKQIPDSDFPCNLDSRTALVLCYHYIYIATNLHSQSPPSPYTCVYMHITTKRTSNKYRNQNVITDSDAPWNSILGATLTLLNICILLVAEISMWAPIRRKLGTF